MLTLMVTMLVVGLGAALLLVTSLENAIEAHHADAHGTRQAADAGLACAMAGLQATPDWSTALAGAAGFPPCLQPVPGWAAAVNTAALTVALQADTDSAFAGSPDVPVWRLALAGGAPAAARAPAIHVLAWIADDPLDGDGDPGADANGHVMVVVTVTGRGGARATVEALLWRDPTGPGDVTLAGWRTRR